MEKTEEQIIEELKSNPLVAKWLNSFKHGDKDKFLEAYAEQKIKLQKKPVDISSLDYYRTRSMELAEEAFAALLRVKYFELQIRWRAGELELSGIKISDDFIIWETNLERCPFIPEVTEEELTILSEFIARPGFRSWDLSEDDLFFDEVLKDIKSAKPKNLWFSFYNQRISKKLPLDKPDIKKEREEYYFDIYRKKKEKKTDKHTDYKAIPTLLYEESFEKMKAMASEVGDKEFFCYLRDKILHIKGSNSYDTDFAWAYLNIYGKEQIALNRCDSWAEAINISMDYHKGCEAKKHLHEVASMHQYKKENGMLDTTPPDTFIGISDHSRKTILEARRLLGEPEDFNF